MKAYIHNQIICEQTSETEISFVPLSLRRKLSQIEKIALFLLNYSMSKQRECKCVFASRWGEWQRTARLILQICNEEEMSPWGFSTSVHNATVGLFSLLKKNKESYTAIAADEKTLEMGMLETFINLSPMMPVLFVFAEEDCPKIYEPKFRIPCKACGLSFLLSQEKSDFQVEINFVKNQSGNALSFEIVKQFLSNELSEIIGSDFVVRKI